MTKQSGSIAIREWAPAIPLKQFAEEMHVSEPTIYGLIGDGEIRSFTMGSRRYLLTASVLAYFERLAKAAQPRRASVERMLAARRAVRKSKQPRDARRAK